MSHKRPATARTFTDRTQKVTIGGDRRQKTWHVLQEVFLQCMCDTYGQFSHFNGSRTDLLLVYTKPTKDGKADFNGGATKWILLFTYCSYMFLFNLKMRRTSHVL